MAEKSNKSITDLFRFLRETIVYRFKTEYNLDSIKVPELSLSSLENDDLLNFIIENELDVNEIIILLLAITSQISPNFFTTIISDVFPNGGEFPEFGGVKGKNHRGIIPTGETILYILCGNDVAKRIAGIKFINDVSQLFKNKVVYLENAVEGEPYFSGRLKIDEAIFSKLILGEVLKPKLSANFPASLIETNLTWDDLILNKKTISEIKEIQSWQAYNTVLINEWNMKGKIKPGFRVLFHGPSGTGKTLTASLLGKYTNRDVYRIDLSMVVSKYIGETEKNLSRLFDKAKDKNWILFFDEADAVFGKRTSTRDAHDKYANQEVSYLLQRIETHSGLVILASNFKNNIDDAFTRRFQSMIAFEMPKYEERLRLWKSSFPENTMLEKTISFEELAKKFTLTGANIINIIQYACLNVLAENNIVDSEKAIIIPRAYILEGIKKEFLKEGKTLKL